MSDRLTFTALGEDVLNIVVSLLHAESPKHLCNLSLVSTFCKRLADPLLYRSLELRYNDKDLAHTERKVHRLLDLSNYLSHHVRNLKVSAPKDSGVQFNAIELENIISGLFRLQSFCWNVHADIPDRVIAKLEEQWPSAKLIIDNYDHNITDGRTFSSPLLHALTFGIDNWKSGHEAQEQFSSLPRLREILLENPQLRNLNIKTKYSWMTLRKAWPEYTGTPHLMNLPLLPSDELPTLHQLRFSGPDTYELDLSHCRLWSQCMDWSHLHTLDLNLSCPQHFFTEIGPHLTSLKSLTMGVRCGDRRYVHWKYGPMTCEDIGFVNRFIESVPGLTNLRITDLDAEVEAVVPAILGSQSKLRGLAYHASMHRRYEKRKLPYAWTTAQLCELKDRCPDLESLEIDFPLEEGKWPSQHATTLSSFTHLTHLKIFVELDESASEFADEYHQEVWGSVPTPPFNEKLGRQVVADLWRGFFGNDKYARLRVLDVRFTRVEVYDRGQSSDIEVPIRVRRAERGDAVGMEEGEGGFVVECKGKWIGGW